MTKKQKQASGSRGKIIVSLDTRLNVSEVKFSGDAGSLTMGKIQDIRSAIMRELRNERVQRKIKSRIARRAAQKAAVQETAEESKTANESKQ